MRLLPLASEAADDFDRLCSVLGTSSLSREQFVDVLHGCGLSEDESDCADLFDRLFFMCKEAEAISMEKDSFLPSKNLQDGHLDSDALRCLYSSHPSYTTCGNPMNTSLALTDYIKDVFEMSMSSKNPKLLLGMSSGTLPTARSSLDRSELAAFLQNLSNSNSSSSLSNDDSSNEEKKSEEDFSESSFYEQIIENMDDILPEEKAKAQELGFEEVASSILRYESHSATSYSKIINSKDLFQGKLAAKMFDPFHTTPDDFVAALDKAVVDHDALNHHVLTSLSMGSWGGLGGTLRRLADFMLAYRRFTSTFCKHLQETMTMIEEDDPTGSHLEILEANLEEEQGKLLF